jgi:Xanthine and CO dehydrogenases maturation factor, XdhC/CoxF family
LSKEIQQIIEKLNAFAPGEKAVLATVVDLVGSGYRRPGARMLIDAEGYAVGTVSGGCLEADVLERAKKVLETGEPFVITYDTTKDENSLFGLGMGCRGVVRILLERFEKENILARALEFPFRERRRQFIGTVISSNRAATGGRIFYNEIERFRFENLTDEPEIFDGLKKNCLEFFASGEFSKVFRYESGNDSFEMFFENVNPPLKLLLFGAGYDALPLVRIAKELGWRVTAIDHRPAFANAERLPEADEIIVSDAENLGEDLFADENSVAVVMTHNYERDLRILPRLLRSKCLYVGALGPKKRTEKLLSETGENFSADELAKLYAPVGLDIGADTPEGIALAIAAEILAILKSREGGFLRNRKGSIYGTSE